MDLFRQRAFDMLETARQGSVRDMEVRCGHDGSLSLVVGEGSPSLPSLSVHQDSVYRLTRRGNRIQVAGRLGRETCIYEGLALSPPPPPPLLLNDQPLYRMLLL